MLEMGFLVILYIETVGVKWPGRKKIFSLFSDTLLSTVQWKKHKIDWHWQNMHRLKELIRIRYPLKVVPQEIIQFLPRKESLKEPVPACVRFIWDVVWSLFMAIDGTSHNKMTITMVIHYGKFVLQAKTFFFGFAETSTKAFAMQR